MADSQRVNTCSDNRKLTSEPLAEAEPDATSPLNALQKRFASNKPTPLEPRRSKQSHLAVMLDFSQFEYISFDCYGTLIDWESGILGYLRPLLQRKNRHVSDGEILDRYSEFEPRAQQTYEPYREVLARVVRDFAARFNFEVSPRRDRWPRSNRFATGGHFLIPCRPLQRLKTRYKLAVLSNIDDDLFAFTAPKLGVELDLVVTAQQVQSYKPSLRNFEILLQRPSSRQASPAARGGKLVPRCGTCPYAWHYDGVGQSPSGETLSCYQIGGCAAGHRGSHRRRLGRSLAPRFKRRADELTISHNVVRSMSLNSDEILLYSRLAERIRPRRN